MFSQEQRRRFIKDVWAQKRLPASEEVSKTGVRMLIKLLRQAGRVACARLLAWTMFLALPAATATPGPPSRGAGAFSAWPLILHLRLGMCVSPSDVCCHDDGAAPVHRLCMIRVTSAGCALLILGDMGDRGYEELHAVLVRDVCGGMGVRVSRRLEQDADAREGDYSDPLVKRKAAASGSIRGRPSTVLTSICALHNGCSNRLPLVDQSVWPHLCELGKRIEHMGEATPSCLSHRDVVCVCVKELGDGGGALGCFIPCNLAFELPYKGAELRVLVVSRPTSSSSRLRRAYSAGKESRVHRVSNHISQQT